MDYHQVSLKNQKSGKVIIYIMIFVVDKKKDLPCLKSIIP